MGNRQSSSVTADGGDASSAGTCPNLNNTQFGLLLNFIADEDPEDEAIKLVCSLEGARAAVLKVPPSLGHDLLLLAPIISLVRSKGSSGGAVANENVNDFEHVNCSKEGLADTAMRQETFTEEEANCITAYLAEMRQPEQAISCLVALGVQGQLRTERPHALEDCLRLLGSLHGALLAILYACGGDPANFVSATRWLHRIHRMCLILRAMIGPMLVQKREKASALVLPSAEQLVIEMALYTVVRNHRNCLISKATINTILFAAKDSSLPGMDKYINVCHLLLGDAYMHDTGRQAKTDMDMEGDPSTDTAIGYLCTFVQGADEESIALCGSLGLSVNDGGSSQYLAEQAICLVLQLFDLSAATTFEQRWKFISAALLYVEDWNESCIRVSLYCQLIEALLATGRYRDAHDRLMEAWTGLQAADKARECARQIVQYLLDEEQEQEKGSASLVCSLTWNEAASAVVDAMLEERLDGLPCPASYHLYYRWKLARADIQGGALVMYRLAIEYYPSVVSGPVQESLHSDLSILNQRYLALQLAFSTLALAPPLLSWLRLSDGTVLAKPQLWVHAVEAKAYAALGHIVASGTREALLVELLQRHLTSHAIELFQAHVANDAATTTATTVGSDGHPSIRSLELMLGYLIDSLVMGGAPEKHSLRGFFPLLSPVSALAIGDDDPVELVIISCLLSSAQSPEALVSHGLGFVIDQLLAYGYRHPTPGLVPTIQDHVSYEKSSGSLPAWLLMRARSSLDPNFLMRILASHQQLDLLEALLKDVSLRNALTPGTRARLQLLVAE